jgi:hypothetical protein
MEDPSRHASGVVNAQTQSPSESTPDIPPDVNLPDGSGAIRRIGEKFAANPVTRISSTTVPIATSPGRSGFGPQLSLSYDSNAGNGPLGLGWSLSIPRIICKTDKGLPRYIDTSESDVFILSGAEDLVPQLLQSDDDTWEREQLPPPTLHGRTYPIGFIAIDHALKNCSPALSAGPIRTIPAIVASGVLSARKTSPLLFSGDAITGVGMHCLQV